MNLSNWLQVYQLICGYFSPYLCSSLLHNSIVQRVVMFHPHELAPKRFVTVTELDVMEMTKLLEMRKED